MTRRGKLKVKYTVNGLCLQANVAQCCAYNTTFCYKYISNTMHMSPLCSRTDGLNKSRNKLSDSLKIKRLCFALA